MKQPRFDSVKRAKTDEQVSFSGLDEMNKPAFN
jgi:hypothetical protein